MRGPLGAWCCGKCIFFPSRRRAEREAVGRDLKLKLVGIERKLTKRPWEALASMPCPRLWSYTLVFLGCYREDSTSHVFLVRIRKLPLVKGTKLFTSGRQREGREETEDLKRLPQLAVSWSRNLFLKQTDPLLSTSVKCMGASFLES